MRELDLFESDEDGGTVFRDVTMLALAGFICIVILLLPHIRPEAKTEAAPLPGNILVELRWPDDVEADVDLWVQAPGDRPVGYSNKGGKIFNLLRDDLGRAGDVTNLNYEVSYARGAPAGEYTVNVHLYRYLARRFPLPVTVAVTVKRDENAPTVPLIATNLTFDKEAEELTAVRFSLDEDARLVPGSLHHLHKPLRNGPR
jgi:hypothetical protein